MKYCIKCGVNERSGTTKWCKQCWKEYRKTKRPTKSRSCSEFVHVWESKTSERCRCGATVRPHESDEGAA